MNAPAENPAAPVPTEQLSPEAIERHLGDLIRRYVRARSPGLAMTVVRHIEKLCNHPAFEGNAAERCSYLRLRTHWLWLAGAVPETYES